MICVLRDTPTRFFFFFLWARNGFGRFAQCLLLVQEKALFLFKTDLVQCRFMKAKEEGCQTLATTMRTTRHYLGGIEEVGRTWGPHKKEVNLVTWCLSFLNTSIPPTFSFDASPRETQFPQNFSFPRSAVTTCSTRAAKKRKNPTKSRSETWLLSP